MASMVQFDSPKDTATIGQLIEFLKNFPPDMPIAAEWENQAARIDLNKPTTTISVDGVDVLLLNVDTIF